MAKIENLNSLQDKLSKRIKQSIADDKVCAVVGYTGNYGLWVHENLEMKWKGLPRHNGHGFYWDPQGKGQSKFLEAPARTFAREIGAIVSSVYKATKNLGKALYTGGLKLQRESMQLVPVDTANLKASAFTRLEELP